MASIKLARINTQMGEIISGVVRSLKDPRLEDSLITISKVDTSNDLSHAKVMVSVFGGDKNKVLNALKSAVPYIRRNTASKIKIRKMPELHFVLDDSLEYANKIETLIKQTKK